jgi:hypothetical protein
MWLLLVLEMRLIVLIEFDCVAKLVYVAISELISLSLLYNNIFNKSAFAIECGKDREVFLHGNEGTNNKHWLKIA